MMASPHTVAKPDEHQFMKALKKIAPDWYRFGQCLGLENHHLEVIATDFAPMLKGRSERCLNEVYLKYTRCTGQSPSWDIIFDALIELEEKALVDEIKKKYNIEFEERSLSIIVDEKVEQEFDSLYRMYSTLVTSVRVALRKNKVNVNDLQSVIQDYCGAEPLPESATLESVLRKMKEHVNCLDVSLLSSVAHQFAKQVQKKIENYCSRLKKFKSSTQMKHMVEDIKEKRKALSAGTQVVTLEVASPWKNVTLKQFEKLVNMVLRKEQLSNIKVSRGCLCITWIAPSVAVDKIIHNAVCKNRSFMDAIAILSLSVGDIEVYKREADPSDIPDSFDSGLQKAVAKYGADIDIDAVQLLLAIEVGANPFFSPLLLGVLDRVGARARDTPLIKACKYGNLNKVSALLKAGADVNQRACDAYGGTTSTPLLTACQSGYSDIVFELLNAGADIKQADQYGDIPLVAACKKGKLDVLSAFIKIRPNAVNQAGQDGVAPLLAAINRAYKYLYFQSQNKFEDINAAVLALIEAGAFIYQADHKDGTTPLLAAINVIISRKPNHHCDYAYRDDKRMEKIVLNLLDAGADPNQSDIHGTTPLMKAREYGIDVLLNPTANQITWDKLQVITAKIKQKTSVIPQIGIICGSGFSGLADELDTDKAIDKIPYKEIGLPKCSGKLLYKMYVLLIIIIVEGHAGRLVFGYLAGQPVVCMQGRYHFYEGHLLAWQVRY